MPRGLGSTSDDESASPSFKPEWEDKTSRGSAILYKMGYRGGGLGKNGTGISRPISTRLRPNAMGLGYNNFKEQTRDTVVDFDGSLKDKVDSDTMHDLQEEEATQRSWTRRSQTTPGEGKKKKKKLPKPQYQTAEDVLKQTGTGKKDTIIDMRDGVARVYEPSSPTSKLADPRSKFCSELQYNTRLLVDMVEAEVHNTASRIKSKEDTVVIYQKQHQQSQQKAEKLTQQIQQAERVIELLEKARIKLEKNAITLDSLVLLFEMLRKKFPREYQQLGVNRVMGPMVFPLFQRLVKLHNPLESPDQFVPFVRRWKQVCFDDSVGSPGEIRDTQGYYYALVDDILLPRLRTCLTSSWSLEQSEPMVRALREWKPYFSERCFRDLFQQSILPQLTRAVQQWEPLKQLSLHVHLLDWFAEYTDELHSLLTMVRQKLSKVVKHSPSSLSELHSIFALWYSVLRGGHFERLLKNALLPQLRDQFVQHFILNPVHQDLDAFHRLVQWRDVVPLDLLVEILEEAFFPPFLHSLQLWLENGPNYLEIHRWYTGWKTTFPDMLLEEDRVIYNFHQALLLIAEHLEST